MNDSIKNLRDHYNKLSIQLEGASRVLWAADREVRNIQAEMAETLNKMAELVAKEDADAES